MTAVSLLGLGAMGSRMAINLADAGHDVTVWNRTPEKAHQLTNKTPISVAETPRDAARAGSVVISMVADDDASRSLWLDSESGVLANLPSDSIAIEASTITQKMAVQLGEAASAAEVQFIEAPVVGSRPQADSGTLFVLAGGEESTLNRVRPVIESYAGTIRHVGAVGNAATMKLAINGLFGIQVAAYAEIVGMLEHSTVPTDLAIEVLANLPITSPGLKRILGLIADRDFTPNFPVALVAKDFNYLEALATNLDKQTPVTSATAKVYNAGADGAQALLDIAGIADRYL